MLPRVPGDPPRDLSRPPDKLRVLVPADQGGRRLDQVLRDILFWRSRTSIRRLIEKGAVLVGEGRKVRPSLKVRPGEVITILLPPRPPLQVPQGPLPEVPVLYEDEFLLAVDKPPGLAVHPSGKQLEGTLIGILHARYPAGPEGEGPLPRLCHRLDKETSGVLLVTKDERARHLLGRQFEERRVKKTYLAVVEGVPDREEGIVDLPLAPDPSSPIRLKMQARRDGRGQAALTRYRVLRVRDPYALLEVRPATGRQHQIRVHLAAMGHPVVGDKIYGPDENLFLHALEGGLTEEEKDLLVLPRHALHAWKLRFHHPFRKEEMEIVAPLPGDMAGLVGLEEGEEINP